MTTSNTQNTHNTRKFQYAIVIGRFQPVHFGHQRLIEEGLRAADRVIVVVGSDRKPRSVKNPFTFDERERMVRACLRGTEQMRVSVVGVGDSPYNDQLWIASIQSAVDRLIVQDGHAPASAKVALVGHLKDASSYYLKLFPHWEFVGQNSVESLNATDVRNLYFDPENRGQLARADLPDGSAAFLDQFTRTADYAELCEERAFLADYRDKYRYAGSSFPPIYTTVDAIVVEAGHILLVQRKFHPGKGTWALPGGFVGQHERLQDAAIRELKEETRLKVPVPVLNGSMKASHVFDAPDRSQRGRTITHGFFFELAHNQWTGLSDVRADDDAAEVRWVPIAEFLDMQDHIYEDHFFIANHFLGGLGKN
ncbi:bifunctional nicotinamide-nucleotide adenylyltransferase/Nudix hydroxylase [Variovorax sp. H27-G14]|uniref:bifunctional nicotinamide-nucleotide adenylyltransferase/Nudix hydroxylase n=1 Tax=Variovorax sp. H27-G14 TaxID=3111914 RepID=UPI0038FC47C4